MVALLDAASLALAEGDFDRAMELDRQYRDAYRREAKLGGWMFTRKGDPDVQ